MSHLQRPAALLQQPQMQQPPQRPRPQPLSLVRQSFAENIKSDKEAEVLLKSSQPFTFVCHTGPTSPDMFAAVDCRISVTVPLSQPHKPSQLNSQSLQQLQHALAQHQHSAEDKYSPPLPPRTDTASPPPPVTCVYHIRVLTVPGGLCITSQDIFPNLETLLRFYQRFPFSIGHSQVILAHPFYQVDVHAPSKQLHQPIHHQHQQQSLAATRTLLKEPAPPLQRHSTLSHDTEDPEVDDSAYNSNPRAESPFQTGPKFIEPADDIVLEELIIFEAEGVNAHLRHYVFGERS
eukprot:m.78419 g.78419  ORF g.78419 m.78419 type:complete len:291 (+) comp12533_c0_seq1:829-1701(+)